MTTTRVALFASGRERRSDVIPKVFTSRTKLRLKNKEKNFKFNEGSERKPMK